MENTHYTYWAKRGTYQNMVEFLNTLIPVEGSVKNPVKNKALEKFRKASNVYYDLYNNGLYNRARSFRGAFGFTASNYAYNDGSMYGIKRYSSALYEMVEIKMDEIVLAAMEEQALRLAVANELKATA